MAPIGLLQLGMVGLLESIDRYRVGEGARFETFASQRVTGAILDGVEALSEKQCQIAARTRALRERALSIRRQAAQATTKGFTMEFKGI